MPTRTHKMLDCGVELAVLHLPNRRAEAAEIRMLAGLVNEPADKLGLAHLVEETLDKGTAKRDGRALSDALDEIGAVAGSRCGRESSAFTSLCLPEFFDRNVELHAEFLRTPTFPKDFCDVALELARQDLLTLEDDAQGLSDKLISRQAFGPLLGRHVSGESHTLDAIAAADFSSFWRENYNAGRMVVSVAGPLEPEKVADIMERHFAGFGSPRPSRREALAVEFDARVTHFQKETEQQHISMALPGVPVGHPDRAAELLLLGVLSGGMSARLFTEVREKQGLVYWVGAWNDNPRGAGMIFVGASTTPQRCDKTYETLLRELKRVGQDVTEEELRRALAGIEVRADIRGDVTRSQCAEQADDLIHYGRPVPWEEKLAKLRAVTVEDVQSYAAKYLTEDKLSVVTLGPRALESNIACAAIR